MASSGEEFEEMLHAEQKIDMNRLCSASSHGIPDNLRSSVWLQLLGINNNREQSISY
jgi:hypothetical protein